MRTQSGRQKLVLIGNGMAGINTIEQLLTYTQDYDITVFGNEPYPNYNRIQLSYVLEGSKSIDEIILNRREWYAENVITLFTDTTVTRIDIERQRVITANGMEAPYDKVIIATGSKPFILPIPGAQRKGVVGFRDIRDCEQMMAAAKTVKQAAIIGGGLLGLEAAKGLVSLGMEVTVVHLTDTLMEKQLDPTAGAMLQKELESQGIRFLLNTRTVELYGEEHVEGLRFSDGSELAAQLVVMAAGIRPNIEVATASGLKVNRGILVDDYLQTSAPNVYAIGECVEHRGECYGLVAPLFEQGVVLAKKLAGVETAPYEGSTVSTKLKISGVDVFSAGEFMEGNDHRVLRFHDDWKQTYKKILLKENRIVGSILFGDVEDASLLAKWVNQQAEMTAEIHERIVGGGCCGSKKITAADAMDDDEIVCGCNGVTKGKIVNVIREQGFTTVEEIKACTGATRSCGGCKPMVEQILLAVLGNGFAGSVAKEQGICSCTPLTRDEVVAAIKEKHLTHVKEVMHVLEWTQPEGCSKCRPAINYYLGIVWPTEHEDERESRFVNERLHANIQKDGTFGVIPRMYGGVTTPAELRKIADVSEKYDVKLVKVTGGQRLDLLGVKKEDLPNIWADLDMPSGYGYAKSLRTVKTCVGSRFCRFGTQDSISTGIALEQKFERISMPAKFKMAVNGCPRNCAESCTKDLGVVGNDGGWEIYVGGNGGIKARMADLLCKVKTEEELMEIAGAFIQLYRETGRYGERTSEWVERIGVDVIQQAIVADQANRHALHERIELAIAQLSDPWKEVLQNQELRERLYEPIHKP
ncbi:MAG TPA: nitrite reductase large subunit NirB [Candidatus Bathyarchaeia archaeon]|nr:nitrite reductase large subunit NirB [Candidatus Bathyarchaeia archaeon]